jgi:hypothetical protein
MNGRAQPSRRQRARKSAVQSPSRVRPRVAIQSPRLAELVRRHFPVKGRRKRIGRALKALQKFEWGLGLDDAMLKRKAEDPDLEP